MKTVVIPDLEKASTEQLQQNLRNMESELPQYQKHLLHHQYLLATNERRLELMEKMSAISDLENEALTPQYKFQQNPEWIKLHREFLILNSAADRKKVADEIESLRITVEKTEEELHRFEEIIPKVKQELAKRGE